MKAKTNIEEIKRNEKLRQLMDARLQQFPNESYEARFSAVANSPEGQALFEDMHLANEDAVPVQNPRIVKLLLGAEPWRYPLPESEYRRRYLGTFGPLSAGSPNSPSYPSEQEEQRRTAKAAGKITDEVKLKEEGRRGFLDEVARLMAAGHEYSEAWSAASSTSPGKEFYAQWARGAAQLKPGA